jgi:hypothetical protein
LSQAWQWSAPYDLVRNLCQSRALRFALRCARGATGCSDLPDVQHRAGEEPSHLLFGACKQRTFRLRRRQAALPAVTAVRQEVKRQQQLLAHTVDECPGCQERLLGKRRCPSCQLFCGALGVGGHCPECDQPILLSDLLGTE